MATEQARVDELDVSLSSSTHTSATTSNLGEASEMIMPFAPPNGVDGGCGAADGAGAGDDADAPYYEDGIKGWLEKYSIGKKKMALFSNWKRRYFILARFSNTVCLGYYEDELGRRPVGFLRLNPAEAKLVVSPTAKTHKKADKTGRDFCVIYRDGKKEFRLLMRASTTEDHDRWCEALARHLPCVEDE